MRFVNGGVVEGDTFFANTKYLEHTLPLRLKGMGVKYIDIYSKTVTLAQAVLTGKIENNVWILRKL